MQIILLVVGKTSENWVETGLKIFEGRLQHYASFATVIVPDVKAGTKSGEEIKRLEAAAILKFVQPTDQLVLLDEAGKQYTSRGFAETLQKWINASPKRLIFLVGGAFGFADVVKQRADAKLSLSQQTFTHQMVRVFFVEQLYRAFTILKGERYHND